MHISLNPEEIKFRLSNAQLTQNAGSEDFPFPHDTFSEQPRPAAVLIPLLRKKGAWHILFTRRTDSLPEHSGQVAFPGGQLDTEDVSYEAAALREAKEEIGLQPDDVHILGILNQYITVTNYLVKPIVGMIPWPYPLRIAANEVNHAFTIPLDWLANPKNHKIIYQEFPPNFSKISAVIFKPYRGEVLWGASARFVINLLEILLVQSHPPLSPWKRGGCVV